MQTWVCTSFIDSSLDIFSLPFAVSVHTLQSLTWTQSSPLLSYSVLLVAVWWLTCSNVCFLLLWLVSTFLYTSETSFLLDLEHPGYLASRTEFYRTHGQSSLTPTPPTKKGPVLVNAGRTRYLLFTTNWGCICVAEVNFHAWYNPAPEGSNQFQTRTSQVQAVANCHTQWSARAVSNMAARTGIFQSLS